MLCCVFVACVVLTACVVLVVCDVFVVSMFVRYVCAWRLRGVG